MTTTTIDPWGPLSPAGPTQRDLAVTDAMTEFMKEKNLFASAPESHRREELLGRLNDLCREWSRRVSEGLGYPPDESNTYGAKIFTFGSYRLGVYGDGSDIDTLCVGPQHLSRDHFFAYLPEVLHEDPAITQVTPVTDAYVPVLKLVFSGISIDLLYASLNLARIPEDLSLSDDSVLRSLDEFSVRSLNGSRVTDGILSVTPNVQTFRLALRLVKYWAKQRGVYANKCGYLGGVSWAILIARTCQLYPNAAAGTIVGKFFRVFAQWQWSASQPVLLRPVVPEAPNSPPALWVWNPKQHPREKSHLMPIITPAYPSMNSTYNVSLSTLELLKAELTRGHEITQRLLSSGSDAPDPAELWELLCERTDFFLRYKYYVQVSMSATNEEDYNKWEGWVESRLRFLITFMEGTEGVWCAQPLLEQFCEPGQKNAAQYYVGLEFQVVKPHPAPKPAGQDEQPAAPQPAPRVQVNLTYAVSAFTTLVQRYNWYAPGMNVSLKVLRRSALPQYVLDQDAERTGKTKKRESVDPCGTGSKKVKSDDTTPYSHSAAQSVSTTPEPTTDASSASTTSLAACTSLSPTTTSASGMPSFDGVLFSTGKQNSLSDSRPVVAEEAATAVVADRS